MITVNIRYIRIHNVEAGSVNIGTTLNIIARPEREKDDTAPIQPPQPVVPPSPAPPAPPTSPSPPAP